MSAIDTHPGFESPFFLCTLPAGGFRLYAGIRASFQATPASSSILLGLPYRRYLLEKGKIRETILTVKDLEEADSLYLVNSVRRRVRALLVES